MSESIVVLRYNYGFHRVEIKKFVGNTVKEVKDRVEDEYRLYLNETLFMPEFAYNKIIERLSNLNKYYDEIIDMSREATTSPPTKGE